MTAWPLGHGEGKGAEGGYAPSCAECERKFYLFLENSLANSPTISGFHLGLYWGGGQMKVEQNKGGKHICALVHGNFLGLTTPTFDKLHPLDHITYASLLREHIFSFS